MTFAPEVYRTLDSLAPWVLGWIAVCTCWTLLKVALKAAGRDVTMSTETLWTEGPGGPLLLGHTVGFVLALMHRDPLSAALFLWWGPGYLITAAIVLSKRPVDWQKPALWTSWGCKLSYVAFMAIYVHHGLYALPFAFSLWIMNDQVRLAWFTGNADRTRRTVEDLWLPRLLYPGLLLIPWIAPIPGGVAAGVLGSVVLLAWGVGLARVVKGGTFFRQPNPTESHNLRDIVYLEPGAPVSAPC